MLNYFKNEGLKNLFALNELDGKLRMKYLNITQFLFSSKTASTAWYNNILESIEEYKGTEEYNKAIKTLNKLYNDMK